MFCIKNLFSFASKPKKLLKKNFRKMMHRLSLEDRFTQIYEIDYWGDATKSGVGSTLESTENLRKELPKLIKQFDINTVFDGPCGDFNWMRLVLNQCDIQYIGGDIVAQLIETNQQKYGSDKVKFIKIDLTQDALPKADLMICRDCLFHLSYEDTLKVLINYLNSQIPYLLTTSYINNGNFKNNNIETGHFRMIDLFSAPYFFTKETLSSFEDWAPPAKPRQMCLWSREQIAEAVKTFSAVRNNHV